VQLLDELRSVIANDADRAAKAAAIVRLLRAAGPYRWVGIYAVDLRSQRVCNIAWEGPNAPAYPTFDISEGLTSRAIRDKRTVNVGDVAADAQYLTALESTRSEIIVPILDDRTGNVVGTLDVESEIPNAFDRSTQALLEECASALQHFWTSHDQSS
jgi:L-methionine (R)-S-oxide reductase